jgi:hypothetical protein
LYERFHILGFIPISRVSLVLKKRNENTQSILQGNEKILHNDKDSEGHGVSAKKIPSGLSLTDFKYMRSLKPAETVSIVVAHIHQPAYR